MTNAAAAVDARGELSPLPDLAEDHQHAVARAALVTLGDEEQGAEDGGKRHAHAQEQVDRTFRCRSQEGEGKEIKHGPDLPRAGGM